ncbi:MAG: tRNA (cytidine/uridine-2'-O-)-methyltransferase TrmJ [Gammaproteobacteria bacterium]|nr:tRNA (cytidine/uridine-2'-O-)-methyltransferase TrmJ [Gammaproteobacteria bacterium]
MDNPLRRIRVVLVEPTHPGNIGAAARAMKTMGLHNLALVRPHEFPCAAATAMAAGADDLLVRAQVADSLQETLGGCGWVIGTSARTRTIPWPVHDPREAAGRALAMAGEAEVAVVFGREHAGLTNDELELCQAVVRIPSDPDFGSLNLGAAVQVLAYELRMQWLAGQQAAAVEMVNDAPPATSDDMARLYAHLEETMIETGFLDPVKPRRLMRRVRRLFNRAGLDRNEVNIIRGFLTAVQDRRRGGPGGAADQT